MRKQTTIHFPWVMDEWVRVVYSHHSAEGVPQEDSVSIQKCPVSAPLGRLRRQHNTHHTQDTLSDRMSPVATRSLTFSLSLSHSSLSLNLFSLFICIYLHHSGRTKTLAHDDDLTQGRGHRLTQPAPVSLSSPLGRLSYCPQHNTEGMQSDVSLRGDDCFLYSWSRIQIIIITWLQVKGMGGERELARARCL